MLEETARLVQDAVDRAYRNGRFHEFEWGLRWECVGHRPFLRSGAAGPLEAARLDHPEDWDVTAGGWRALLKWRSDSELLGVPGIGRQRLRAIRTLAPRHRWASEPDGAPHRDRLRPPPPKGAHPWWLLP